MAITKTNGNLGPMLLVLSDYIDHMGLSLGDTGQLLLELSVLQRIVRQEGAWGKVKGVLTGTPCVYPPEESFPGIEEAFEFGLIVRTQGKRLKLTPRGVWLSDVCQGVPPKDPLPVSPWFPSTASSQVRERLRAGYHPIGHSTRVQPARSCADCEHATRWPPDLVCKEAAMTPVRSSWYACTKFDPKGKS